jgi:hypothetical protein
MSDQIEETAILGLRTQILGKHSTVSKPNTADISRLALENLRHIHHDPKDSVIATAYQPEGWIAIAFNKTGQPICSSHGGDETVVDALRNLLKHLSERIGDYFDVEYLRNAGSHDGKTEAGIDYEQC